MAAVLRVYPMERMACNHPKLGYPAELFGNPMELFEK